MIIGKQIRRALICALCFILVTSAVSCSNFADTEALSELEKFKNSQTDNEAVEDNVNKYRIVISAEATDTVFGAAVKLSGAVEEKTGIICTVVRDVDEVCGDGTTGEIQLGYVDRKESREVLRLRNRDDYICIKFSDAVVLGGKSESATVAAAERFIAEIIPKAEGKRIMNDGDGFEVCASYPLSSIKLCGRELSNYGITVTDETQEVASVFRELLANQCGAYPDISFGTVRGIREIVFEISDGTQEGFCSVSYDGEDVILSSDGAYGLSLSAYKLYEAINSSISNGIGYVDISSPLLYSYEAKETSAVSATVDGSDPSALKSALASLCAESADVITLGAVSREAWMMAEGSIPEAYSYVLCQLDGDMKFPVIYKKTSFNDLTVQITEDNGAVLASIGENGEPPRLVVAFEKLADNRQSNVDGFLKQVGESPYGVVGTFMGAVGSERDFSAVYDGASVEYLTTLDVGGNSQSVVAAVTEKIVECQRVECKSVQDGSAVYIMISARNVYCEDLFTLIT